VDEHKPFGLSEGYRRAGPYMGLGIEFAVTIILCFVLGRWADVKFGFTPYLSIGCLFLGMTAAFVNLMRTVNRLQNREEDRRTDPNGGTGK
jgi:F0F1-type ATP synthase assembly protein I